MHGLDILGFFVAFVFICIVSGESKKLILHLVEQNLNNRHGRKYRKMRHQRKVADVQ